jgi:hypothetical protein
MQYSVTPIRFKISLSTISIAVIHCFDNLEEIPVGKLKKVWLKMLNTGDHLSD